MKPLTQSIPKIIVKSMGASLGKSERSVVILGSGYAALGAASALSKYFKVTVVSPTGTTYLKVSSPRALSVEGWDNLLDVELETSSSYTVVHGTAKCIDAEKKLVELVGGDSVPYDYCIIAIGSSNAFANLGKVIHSSKESRLQDWTSLREAIQHGNRILIAGGGIVGVECAGECK